MVYCVGLTGNIASGKSTVAAIFATLGIDIINADKIAKELTLKDQYAYQQIVTHFGTTILSKDSQIDRRKLRELIFSDPKKRQWLEQLLHPLIRQKIEHEASLCRTKYCLIEIPLLTSKEEYPYLNKILVVTSPIKIQIERVMARDQCTREHALAILATQPDNKTRIRNADDVLVNDSGIEKLKQAVTRLHNQYLSDIKSTQC